jgi:hypothetical protein
MASCAGNIWTFEPFQYGRYYRFRQGSDGSVVRGIYLREKFKEEKRPDPEREYEFETTDGRKTFQWKNMIEPRYVGMNFDYFCT